MKVKKGLNKFSISNRLAYTLIVILSIALLGIGVYAYNPTLMGHPATDLNLNWGAVSTCEGAPAVCSNYPELECDTSYHPGCFMGCWGGEIYLSCYDIYTEGECRSVGCTWSWDPINMISYCTGISDPFLCEEVNNPDVCTDDFPYKNRCTWGCGGAAYGCNYYNTLSDCQNNGCSWVTRQRSITNTSQGISIPNLYSSNIFTTNINANYFCDLSGGSCYTRRPIRIVSNSLSAGDVGDDRKMRDGSYVSCPEGSYLTKVEIEEGYHGDDGRLIGECKTLPLAY